MGVGQYAFARFKAYNRMVKRDVVYWVKTVEFAPLAMRQGFMGTIKITFHILGVKWIINGTLIHPLNAVVVITQGHVKAGVANMLGIKRVRDNVALIDGLPDLCIAVYSHSHLLKLLPF
jgi:hypothetical protein